MDIEALKKFVPFSELQEEYLIELITLIEMQEHQKGELLFKRSRAEERCYYLLDGEVDLIGQSFTTELVNAHSERALTALNPDDPTLTSCVAKTHIKTFTVPRESLERTMTWSESAQVVMQDPSPVGDGIFHVEEIEDSDSNDWMSSLLQSPMLARIPNARVQELFKRFSTVNVTASQQIVKEGDPGDYFYVISNGRAKVTNQSNDINAELNAGNFFGEEALLGDTVRNASVTMLTDGVLKRLTCEDFTFLLQDPVLDYLKHEELNALNQDYMLLDVKTPIEYKIGHLPESKNIPLSRLRAEIEKLDREYLYLIPNDCGSRANIAAHLLCREGFEAKILTSS